MTGQGYLAIVDHEEEDRKHNETLALQKIIVRLTVVLAAATVAASWTVFEKLLCWGKAHFLVLAEHLSKLW